MSLSLCQHFYSNMLSPWTKHIEKLDPSLHWLQWEWGSIQHHSQTVIITIAQLCSHPLHWQKEFWIQLKSSMDTAVASFISLSAVSDAAKIQWTHLLCHHFCQCHQVWLILCNIYTNKSFSLSQFWGMYCSCLLVLRKYTGCHLTLFQWLLHLNSILDINAFKWDMRFKNKINFKIRFKYHLFHFFIYLWNEKKTLKVWKFY